MQTNVRKKVIRTVFLFFVFLPFLSFFPHVYFPVLQPGSRDTMGVTGQRVEGPESPGAWRTCPGMKLHSVYCEPHKQPSVNPANNPLG